MRLTFDLIRHDPEVFRGLTGLLPSVFESIAAEVRPRFEAADRARLDRPGRRRAIGAGRRYELDATDQAFLALVWLRHTLKHAALGHLFGVSEWTAMRAVGRMLPLLEATGRCRAPVPPPARCRRKGLDTLLQDFPRLARFVRPASPGAAPPRIFPFAERGRG
jgi:hypothetical protein